MVPAPFVESGREFTAMLELLLQTSLNALYAASFMALVAVGLVLIFGVMGIINFAHGELYMLGAYAVVAVYADFKMSFFLAVAIGLVFVGMVGIGMERGLFRPMRDNPLGGLVVSIGFLFTRSSASQAPSGTWRGTPALRPIATAPTHCTIPYRAAWNLESRLLCALN